MTEKSKDWLEDLSRMCIRATETHGTNVRDVIADVDVQLKNRSKKDQLDLRTAVKVLVSDNAQRGKLN